MSRIGNAPINLPEGVEVKVDGAAVSVKGKKGELFQEIDRDLSIEIEDNVLTVKRPTDQKRHKAMHGLYRSLISNMVVGVSEGYKIELELVGVGFRASNSGQVLEMALGFSHPVDFEVPAGVTIEAPSQTEIVVKGADKQLVGQVAANIRKWRQPEPYKGKGVRYADEHVRRKEAKKK